MTFFLRLAASYSKPRDLPSGVDGLLQASGSSANRLALLHLSELRLIRGVHGDQGFQLAARRAGFRLSRWKQQARTEAI